MLWFTLMRINDRFARLWLSPLSNSWNLWNIFPISFAFSSVLYSSGRLCTWTHKVVVEKSISCGALFDCHGLSTRWYPKTDHGPCRKILLFSAWEANLKIYVLTPTSFTCKSGRMFQDSTIFSFIGFLRKSRSAMTFSCKAWLERSETLVASGLRQRVEWLCDRSEVWDYYAF